LGFWLLKVQWLLAMVLRRWAAVWVAHWVMSSARKWAAALARQSVLV
jgi:hypothetical protein